MASKKDLVKMLRECLTLEEDAIPIYAKHIENTLFLADLKKAGRDKLKDMLNRLKMESEGHRDVFQGLIKKVEGADRDVY